jgi:hypothetical protein
LCLREPDFGTTRRNINNHDRQIDQRIGIIEH